MKRTRFNNFFNIAIILLFTATTCTTVDETSHRDSKPSDKPSVESVRKDMAEPAEEEVVISRDSLIGRKKQSLEALSRTSGAPSPMVDARQFKRSNDIFNTESYDRIYDNEYKTVKDNPLSTFSIDVDTASYSNVRRFLNHGSVPPPDAVRVEEMVNYFNYDYPEPMMGDAPFSVFTEVGRSPWSQDNLLLHIGLKGKSIAQEKLPPRNLVFLLDVSGSMSSPDKLPLLVKGMKMLTEQLTAKDTVSIVVYAGASGQVLSPTGGDKKALILEALDRLEAGGSTNGGEGIELAYQSAEKNFQKDGINRVILATDGDFNVGTTNEGDLTRLIEKKRESGIFLTVLGFGSGNLKDSTMEKLADKGNGNYAYIDSVHEAKKVLVSEAGSTLVTIAKDVKIQIEFNPAEVRSYRLIGYENRMLASEDFNDDKKDAGEIGAGHTVTALYEIVPVKSKQDPSGNVDPLKYQKEPVLTDEAGTGELVTVKLRYKAPNGSRSTLITHTVPGNVFNDELLSDNYRFSAAVASFGMILRNSPHKGKADWDLTLRLAKSGMGPDREGHRAEFISLVHKAKGLSTLSMKSGSEMN